MNGAERVCATLGALGSDTVFGLPGSQNVGLYAAAGQSPLRLCGATSETAAAFMANGYARATGAPGILFTIPGPGFAFALPGIAEAWLDSVPLIHFTGMPARAPGRAFQLQAIDQAAMARPVVKAVIEVQAGAQVDAAVREAHALSLAGEPGPVLVQLAPEALSERADPGRAAPPMPTLQAQPDGAALEALVARLRAAHRPLLYAGQGAQDEGALLASLCEAARAPLLTTTSGRGAVAESHPWLIASDLAPSAAVQDLFAAADLVLAIGVKFSHNGARGFRLALPPANLVHVDSAQRNLGANYPASLSLGCDAHLLLRALVPRLGGASSRWTAAEIAAWRVRLAAVDGAEEPLLRGTKPPEAAAFFAALGAALPAQGVLTLDSGRHQMLARRHLRIKGPRSLMAPTNFQSMGYAIPAAIGALCGRPDATAVAVVGDGGFALSGMELLSAARERFDLTVVVCNDGHYSLIRDQQLGAHGTAHGTSLWNPDFARFAAAAGVRHVRVRGDLHKAVGEMLAPGRGVVLAEVVLRDSVRRRLSQLRDKAAGRARGLLRFARR